MRVLARILLAAVFFAAVALACFLLLGPREKENWATMTGVLAVIAAVISAWPSLRVLEIQEDATRPCPIPYFDLSSRYGLMLLRVKNLGAGIAYDVQLEWTKHPQNEEGEEVTTLDALPVLPPQASVSVNVGRPRELFKKYPTMRFEGTVRFKDVTRRDISQPFVCSADEHRRGLVHDDELLRTLYDVQQIPKELKKIDKAIQDLRQSTLAD